MIPHRKVRLCLAVPITQLVIIQLIVLSVASGADEPRSAERQALTDGNGDPLPRGAVTRLGTIRFRQAGDVIGVAYSSDEKTLASCTYLGEVRLWDVTTGKIRCKLRESSTPVRQIAFSPDGKTLSGVGHVTVYLWDVATGKEVTIDTSTIMRNGDVNSVAFSPNGKMLATGVEGGSVAIWDVAERKLIHQIDGNKCTVSAIAFSADGNLLAWAGVSSTGNLSAIYIWEVTKSKLIGKLLGHDKGVESLAFSPDSKTLASGSTDNTVRLWEVNTRDKDGNIERLWGVNTGEESRMFETWGMSMAFSSDGKTLASGDNRGTIHLWDPTTGKEKLSIFAGGGYVHSLAFSKNGKELASASGSSAIGLWHVATGKEVIPLAGHRQAIHALAFSADGRKLATRGFDRSVHTWDVGAPNEHQELKITDSNQSSAGPSNGRSVNFLPDGKRLVVLGSNRTALVWDLEGHKKKIEMCCRMNFPCMDLSPDGATLAFAGWGGIQLLGVDTGKEVGLLDFLDGAKKRDQRDMYVTFSPDGRTLASGCSDSKIRIWDWRTGKRLLEILSSQPTTRCLAYSPDGRILASCGTKVKDEPEGSIFLWEISTGALIRKLEGHKGQATFIAFSPDGMTLASAGEDDKTVRVWNVFTGKELAKFEGHTGAVTCVGFSPDGKLLVSGSADTTALLWDATKIDSGLPAKVGQKEFEKAWTDLASENRAVAYAAIPVLSGGGDDATAFLKDRLKPAAEADERRILKLIADLDGDDFDTREAAAKELGKIGAAAEPFLKKALEGKPSEEARKRLEALLPEGKAPLTSPEGLRELRAVMVLERIGTKSAREVLAALAKGAPEAPLTRHAKLAVERLDQKAGK